MDLWLDAVHQISHSECQTRALELSLIWGGTAPLFIQSWLLWVPPSPNGGRHSHSSFCSRSTFSQQSSPKWMSITSRVRRHNGSHAPLKPTIALGKCHRTPDGVDACRQTSPLQTSWYKRGEHFCLGWATATCPGRTEKEIFSSWGFIAGFWPFPAAPRAGLWLKRHSQGCQVSLNVNHHTSELQLPEQTASSCHSQLFMWCLELSQINTILFLWRKKSHRLFVNHSIIYLSHTNHRSKASPFQTTERSQGPEEADV